MADGIEQNVIAWRFLPEPYFPKINKGKTGEWICLGHRIGFLKHPWSVDYKCPFCDHEEYTLLMGPPSECPHCGATLEQGREQDAEN